MGLDVVVLAGARNNGELAQVSNEEYEALIKINGIAMIDYVLDTLKEVELIDEIIVVGPEKINKSRVDTFIPCQDSLLQNIKLGLSKSKTPYTLLVTSDIPLITSDAIIQFLKCCEESKAAFYYPLVTKEAIERDFPQQSKTYFNLIEGSFTGGNIFLVNGEILFILEALLDKILKWRKKPWKLAYLLGFKFIVKLLTASLSINIIEEEFCKLTGYIGKAIVLDKSEIGFDVDQLKQLEAIKKIYKSSEIKSS